MARFRDLPIRSKLMTGFMLTTLVALLVMMGALSFYDRKTFREEALADINVPAGVIGENASSWLVFTEPKTARSTPGPLRAPPHITAGTLYHADGPARHLEADPLAAQCRQARLPREKLRVARGEIV